MAERTVRHWIRPLLAGALLGCALTALAPTAAEAQLGKLGRKIADKAKEKAGERIDQRTDEATGKAVDAADPTGKIGKDKQKAAGGGTESGAAADGPATSPQAAARQKPGEGAWANYDFVPGERVIFAEDFTKDRVGNFPQRLELLTGNSEVVEWKGTRWLRMNDRVALKVPLPETLPQRFTMEFDIYIPWNRMLIHADPSYAKGDYEGANETLLSTSSLLLSGTEIGVYRGKGEGKSAVDPRNVVKDMRHEEEYGLTTEPHRIRLHVDGRYIKAYLNESRIANMPNGNFGRANYVVFEFDDNTVNGEDALPLITNLTVNAGGRSLYDALSADGRVATQGILFDTGSDRIRPESTPTLAEISAMLKEHPDLKVLVEGHTDNVGNAASNQTLSEKRAAAVKAYLQAQGIDGARLQSKGLGDTKPKAPNTTPEGRQTNRRVELVKL